MTTNEEVLLRALSDKTLWRIPDYPTLMGIMGYRSKNSLHKALRQLQKKGFVDSNFKPITPTEVSKDL